jgi:hypothetical protein
LHGPDVNQGVGFAPRAKIIYDVACVGTNGTVWHADYGAISNISLVHLLQHPLDII